MQTYRIARLAKRPKGTRVEMPPISERLGTVLAYRKALRAMLNALARETREGIIPAYERDRRQQAMQRRMVQDGPEKTWFIALRALAVQLQRTASDTVDRILGLEAERHTAEFMTTAKRALGIDLAAVVRQEDLAEYLAAAAARNASLITGLADDTVKRIEQTVVNNAIAGNSVATLRKALVEEFGVAGRRAELIARDQSSKLNSDLSRIRHQQAGVTEYRWATSRDERVRSRHRQLEGKVYKYGEATGAENGLPPGQPDRCRCVARAIVEF